MKVAGSHTLAAGPDRVWDALLDPAVLAASLPGCQRLEVTGPDTYAATVEAGVASITGTYEATVEVSDKVDGEAYTLRAVGAGAPGTVDASARVTLASEGTGTVVTYDADAVVGGTVAAVGQRVMSTVAKRTAGEFFGNVDDVIAGRRSTALSSAPADGAATAAAAGAPVTFSAPAAPPGERKIDAMVAGALIALLGVLVGRLLGPRRR